MNAAENPEDAGHDGQSGRFGQGGFDGSDGAVGAVGSDESVGSEGRHGSDGADGSEGSDGSDGVTLPVDAGEDARRRARLAAERTDYHADSLADDPGPDPWGLFGRWVEDAFARRDEVGDLPEPSAVVLSTVELRHGGSSAGGPSARPRSRAVLLKSYDEDGLVVYTNQDSAKGRQLRATPWASLLLPWFPLQRQIRADGQVEDVDAETADAYWASRPRRSQLGAWASHQSHPVTSRSVLEAAYAQAETRFEGVDVPRPAHWGGYRLVPDRIEFWQGRRDRLHDRIVYDRTLPDGAWQRHRLQP